MVPAVTGVLAQPVDELGERLLPRVEVVAEGLLEHLVRGLDVDRVGQPLRRTADQPDRDLVLGPGGRVGHQRRLVGGDGTAHLQPAADPLEAGRLQPGVLAVVVGERAGVDLLHVELACRTDRPRLLLRPREQQRRAGVRHVAGQVALDDVHEQHPALGAVVDAAPGPDLAVGVAQHDVLAHPQAALGDLDQHVVDRGRGPAAAGPLVPAQQVGQSGDHDTVGRVGLLHPPVVEQVLGVREEPVWVAVEPVVLGDHVTGFCRTAHVCPRPVRRPVPGTRRRPTRKGVRRAAGAARPARPGTRPARRRAPARARPRAAPPRRPAPRPRRAAPRWRGRPARQPRHDGSRR